jgi:hypothetical protein
LVAQIFNLPYRGFLIRQGQGAFGRSAECNSAKQQSETLRYEESLMRPCVPGVRT